MTIASLKSSQKATATSEVLAPNDVRALIAHHLSPRELAVNFTDTKGSFVSEATVYRARLGRSQKDGLPCCRGETFHSRFKVIDAR